MSWQAITAAEVLQEWNAKETGLIKNQQAAADNLPALLTRVVNGCRACVRAGGGRIGPDGTIPDQLREDVIAIARWRLLLSLPEVEEAVLSRSRKDAYTESMGRFDKVAAGTLKVEPPDTALDVAAPNNAVEVASSQPRVATRQSLEGF